MSEKRFGLDLTQGRVSTLLLRFAAPFLLANLVSALYGVVDMIIVGQFTSGAIMSGVATGTQIISLMYSFIIGLGTGGTVLIGRYIGAKNDEGSSKATGSFLAISAAVVVLLTAVIWFMREPLLVILKTPAEAVGSARRFVMICTIGVPFNIGYGMLSAVSRGLGNSRVPGIIAATSCVVNVALAYTLVGIAGLAEVGAAIATAGAQIVSFTLVAAWIYRKKLPFKFSARDIRINGESTKQIFLIGMPIVLQELLITVSFMIIIGLANAISVEASAAVGVVSRAFNIAVVFPLAMSSAISAMTAQSLGAGRPERAMQTLRWGILYALVFALAIFGVCQLWPEKVTGLFAKDYAVIKGAAGYLQSFFIDAIFVAFIFCMNAYLSGCGKSNVSMVHSLVAAFFIRVPLSFIFTHIEGTTVNEKLHYMGFASPIASVLSLVVCVLYIAWYNKRLVATDTLAEPLK